MSTTPSNKRPYPNVLPTESGKWEARHPRNGRSRHLGTYATAEAAYAAVLLAQAEHLERKAASYRARAAELHEGAPTRAQRPAGDER